MTESQAFAAYQERTPDETLTVAVFVGTVNEYAGGANQLTDSAHQPDLHPPQD